MSEKLLPCPFCGSDAEFERVGNRRQSTIVSCTSCAAMLESNEEWDHGRLWNTRMSQSSDPAPQGMQPDWQPIRTAPKDGRDIEVRYLTDDPRMVRWSQSHHGTTWHLSKGIGPVIIEFEPTEWRDVVTRSAATSEWRAIDTRPADAADTYPIQVCGGDLRRTSVAWYRDDDVTKTATHWAPMLPPIARNERGPETERRT